MNPENLHKNDETAQDNAPIAPVPSNDQSLVRKTENIQPELITKKKRSTMPITLAFLAGAVVFALFSAGYNFYTQSTRQINEQKLAAEEEKELVLPATPVAPGSISEDALSKYVDVTNCIQKSEYAALELGIDKGSLAEIDLYDGAKVLVKTGAITKTSLIGWDALPVVLDYKCDKIEITEITTDDRVNVYFEKGGYKTVNNQVSEAKILQKANK